MKTPRAPSKIQYFEYAFFLIKVMKERNKKYFLEKNETFSKKKKKKRKGVELFLAEQNY